MSDAPFYSAVRRIVCMTTPLRHDALWVVLVTLVVGLVSLWTLYGADPRFHAVWEYTPHAIPTLSLVESVLQQQPLRVPSNHATWFGVWSFHFFTTTPKWIVILLYLSASTLTAITAYSVFRSQSISVVLAAFGAIAFAIVPARFAQPVMAQHWWITMPVILWWGLSWWEGKYLSWQQWRRREWILFVVTIVVLSLFGHTLWWWSMIVLLTAAGVAALAHRTLIPFVIASVMVGVSWGCMTLLYQIWPIPLPPGDNGIRLSALWAPAVDHRILWLAQLGADFSNLDLVHTDAVYIGMSALVGIGIMVAYTLVRSAGVGQPTVIHRLLLVLGVIVIIANQRGLWVLAQFYGVAPFSSSFVDIWIAFVGITALVFTLQRYRVPLWVVGGLVLLILIDHVPRTNIMYQMMQRPQLIAATQSWRDGIWFGQQAQADDVRTITGLGDIEPGYGRWSDAALAEFVEVVLADPITQPLTLEIRARGVGANIGAPVVVQIGAEQQTMVLTGTVNLYRLTFTNPSGNTVRIYPQPVKEPPPGDSRLLGVLIQSMRVAP